MISVEVYEIAVSYNIIISLGYLIRYIIVQIHYLINMINSFQRDVSFNLPLFILFSNEKLFSHRNSSSQNKITNNEANEIETSN